jgi:hypothetical protein
MTWVRGALISLAVMAPVAPVLSQTTAVSVSEVLQQPLQNAEVTAWQIRQHVAKQTPKLVAPTRAEQWTAEARRLRQRTLETTFHGWPKEWIDSPPVFQDLGELRAGRGYRLRKLRYEIVPGFQSSALLYEPETVHGKVPAILDVNGHEPEGKAMEYIQKRCINQARHGVLALNLEWIGMGELAVPGNVHWNNAYLDFAGANGLGLFYLAMRRGLDYLWSHPDVDRRRIGITGLSGGGWQSIVLGSLDERVFAALPDAGYRSILSVGGAETIGDNEQTATDLNSDFDYMHLTALRAPRPTMLIYNENDNCCFRAPRMKPFLYDSVLPIFKLYGAEGDFYWYENTDPGDHNYQLDNRLHSYAFFERYFKLPLTDSESPADEDVLSADQLTIGLPEANLTILTLARKFADNVRREPVPSDEHRRETWIRERRGVLKQTIRHRPVTLESAWPVANTWGGGLKSIGYRFDFDNGLSADGALLRSATTSDQAPWTIVVNDSGKKAAAASISDRVNRGEQVLAVDLLFTGDAAPPPYYFPMYDRMLATEGSRSLGLEVGQLIAIARWLKERSGRDSGMLQATGMRSQAVATVSSALDPATFSTVSVRHGLNSWAEVFSRPVRYQDAPELFCLDLYREFDLPDLIAIANPVKFENN